MERNNPARVHRRAIGIQNGVSFRLQRRDQNPPLAQQLAAMFSTPSSKISLNAAIIPTNPRRLCVPASNFFAPRRKHLLLRHKIRATHIVPAVNGRIQMLLQRTPDIQHPRCARP